MTDLPLVLVAAVARNGVIGSGNALPFRLSSDLKHFKALTTGKAVIMGRKTYESIGRPLPDRLNIVITRDPARVAGDVSVVASLDEAITAAAAWSRAHDAEEIMVIGGGEIYALAMPLADRLELTHVDAEPQGDTRFPAVDPALWDCITGESLPAGPKDDHAVQFATCIRRKP